MKIIWITRKVFEFKQKAPDAQRISSIRCFNFRKMKYLIIHSESFKMKTKFLIKLSDLNYYEMCRNRAFGSCVWGNSECRLVPGGIPYC